MLLFLLLIRHKYINFTSFFLFSQVLTAKKVKNVRKLFFRAFIAGITTAAKAGTTLFFLF